MDGFSKPVRPPKGLRSSIGVPMASNGSDLQDARIVEVGDAFVLVFLEQGFEHGAGLLAVLGEDVALADILGPLAPGERRLVEGHVADQVEGVEVLAHFLGQRIEQQAFVLQFLDDGLLALGAVPASEEIVEAGEALAERLLRVVAQALGDQLAVFVEVFDALGQDADRSARECSISRRLAPAVGMLISGGSGSTIISSSSPGSGGMGSSPSSVGGTSSGGCTGSSSPGS